MRRGLLACCAALTLLCGCSSAVEVSPPAGASSAACQAVAGAWPSTLGGQEQVATDPDDPAVHAWGKPAIIARCGVPALGPTEDPCVVVDGVDWVAEDLQDGTRLTTFGREPALEVLVPADHGPAPVLLPGLTAAAEKLPRNDLRCV